MSANDELTLFTFVFGNDDEIESRRVSRRRATVGACECASSVGS